MRNQKRSSGKYMLAFIAFVFSSICLMGAGQEAKQTDTRPLRDSTKEGVVSYRLRLRVLETTDLFPCGLGATAVTNKEVEKALQTFSLLQNDTETLQAITHHLGLGTVQFDNDEKLLIYCDYQRLQAIHLVPWGDKYKVMMDANHENRDNAQMVTLIDQQGRFDTVIIGTSVGGGSPSLLPDRKSPNQTMPRVTTPIVKLDSPDIRYRLIRYFGSVHVCGPRLVPANYARQEAETFSEIQKDSDTLHLITQHLGIEDTSHLSEQEKILIYREYTRLRVILLEHLVQKYRFQLRVIDETHAFKGTSIFLIVGSIDPQGHISVLSRQPVFHIPCPK